MQCCLLPCPLLATHIELCRSWLMVGDFMIRYALCIWMGLGFLLSLHQYIFVMHAESKIALSCKGWHQLDNGVIFKNTIFIIDQLWFSYWQIISYLRYTLFSWIHKWATWPLGDGLDLHDIIPFLTIIELLNNGPLLLHMRDYIGPLVEKMHH